MPIVTGFVLDPEVHRFGKLCKREHDHEGTGKSLRYLCNGSCLYCDDIRWRKWDAENRPPKIDRSKITRVYIDSIEFDSEIHKLSKTMCQKGHDHCGLDKALRYKTSGSCVYCIAERREGLKEELNEADRQRYHSLTPEQKLKRNRENRAKLDKEKVREYFRQYYYSEKGSLVIKKSRQRFAESEKGIASARRKGRMRRMRIKEVKAGVYSFADLKARLQEFDCSCAYCGIKDTGEKRFMQMDHVVPISKGGQDDMSNLVPACIHCNASKNDSFLEFWYPKKKFATLERIEKVLSFLSDEHLRLFNLDQLHKARAILISRH